MVHGQSGHATIPQELTEDDEEPISPTLGAASASSASSVNEFQHTNQTNHKGETNIPMVHGQSGHATIPQELTEDDEEPISPTLGGEETYTGTCYSSDTDMYGPGPTATPGFALSTSSEENIVNAVNPNLTPRHHQAMNRSVSELRMKINECKDKMMVIQEHVSSDEEKIGEIDLQTSTRLPPPPMRKISTAESVPEFKDLPASPEQNMPIPQVVPAKYLKASHFRLKSGGSGSSGLSKSMPMPSLANQKQFSIASDHGVNTISYGVNNTISDHGVNTVSYQHHYEIAATLSSPSPTPISMISQVPKFQAPKR
eukprot:CAMPEP_0201594464 /NCGR_PEP_ID=MMETSP0190_2-20130828/191775_1 /ASSEMBLY_ACC=CAM_ASM_000263 /TAXON_ID=37353 /ORGANISM="Rosalina sp." /LENGTH=312 /DNA_ID=CAMNT_0048054089 /DNA_START=442 /DNA_END=1383 /DNA_ORIENTATION=+